MGREDLARESDLVFQLVGGQSCGIRSLWGVQAAMKIRIVSSKDEIPQLDPEERVVHLATPAIALAFEELIKRCSQLEAVQVPPSRFRNVSKRSRAILEVQGVRIFEGLLCGYRTARAEYYIVDDGLILQRAGELRAEGLDSEEIAEKVAEEAKVSPGLVEYVLGR